MARSSRRGTLVSTSTQAFANIRRFAAELERSRPLQSRLRQFRSWYALREGGGWLLAPSKFIGYRDNAAEKYLERYTQGGDGRETERALEAWFGAPDPDSRIGQELLAALDELVSAYGKTRNKNARINLPLEMLEEMPAANEEKRDRDLLGRITSDPRVCGGRPCVRGTRMRVSDVVDLLAHGASHAELLLDYPFLQDDDIAAALLYAARAADHRVIRAA